MNHYVKKNRSRFLQDLCDFLSIPSVSAPSNNDKEQLRAAQWLVDRLQSLGARNLKLIPTENNPLVYGELDSPHADVPTVLVYGHYDVVGPGEGELWESDPFSPSERDGYLYARGAGDMKGPLLSCLFGLEAALASGELGCKVVFLFEGAEELSPEGIRNYIEKSREQLTADFAFSADAGMLRIDQPTITYSLKGFYGCHFAIHGPSQPLHSGMFGGAVQNPAHVLSEIVAGLHDDSGRITLEGFYDDIIEPTESEIRDLKKRDLNEKHYLEETGVAELWGEKDYSPAERIYFRPSVNVCYISAGEPKTSIPAYSEAYIVFRLVPGQDPDSVEKSFKKYVGDNLPATVRLEIKKEMVGSAISVCRDIEGVKKLERALRKAWGQDVVYTRCPGGLPVVALMEKNLGIPTVLTGFTAPGDNIHGANERIHIDTWLKGIEALGLFFSGG